MHINLHICLATVPGFHTTAYPGTQGLYASAHLKQEFGKPGNLIGSSSDVSLLLLPEVAKNVEGNVGINMTHRKRRIRYRRKVRFPSSGYGSGHTAEVTKYMSRRTWAFLCTIWILSGTLSVLAIPVESIPMHQWATFYILVILAVFAQFFEAEFGQQSYYPHTVFFFAGLILLHPFLFVLLIVVPHLVEWITKRIQNRPSLKQWYIQPTNIAIHILAGFAAQQVYYHLGNTVDLTDLHPAIAPLYPVLNSITTMAVYLVINHALVGQSLRLARGISWRESNVFNAENLMTELIMMSIGYVAATLWQINTWLIIPALSPLFLVYRALKIPQLQKQAQTDPKTGLFNATHFKREFQSELERARRYGRPLSVVMADLDLLREINNTYGHLGGDAVIQGIAQLIKSHTRDYDISARFGGEEFAMVFLETDCNSAYLVADRLRQSIENTVFRAPGTSAPIHATMSFGIACFPEDGESMDALVHAADTALYHAKFKGRNTVVLATDVPHSEKLGDIDSPGKAPFTTTPGANAGDTSDSEQVPARIEDRQAKPITPGSPVTTQTPAPSQVTAEEQAAPAPDKQSEQETGRWPWPFFHWTVLELFVAGIIITAVVAAGYGLLSDPISDPVGIGLLTALAVLAELYQINVYDNNTVSVSVAVTVAAAVIGAIPGVIAVSTAITVVHFFKMRPAWYKALFNWSTHVLAAIPAAVFLDLPGFHIGIQTLPALSLIALPMIGALYTIETGLIAIAIALSNRSRVMAVWQESFRWLMQNYMVLGIIGLFLAVTYQSMGVMGIIVFVLPAVLVHYSQKMYVERTEASVRELRRLNEELSQANREIRHANRAIQELNNELFLTLAKIIDARDPFVSSHAMQVANIAAAICRKLELPQEQAEHIRQAALLHDIGKLGIPESILLKPGRLTDEEYEVIKTHAALGGDLLETSQGLRHLAPFVRHHHERWDGRGYPDGLSGEQIPLESRILAVCDSIEAMASDRPYKQARSIEEILTEVKRCAGKQFDPAVVDAFLAVAAESEPNVVMNSAELVTLPRNGRITGNKPVGRRSKHAQNDPIPLPILGQIPQIT